MEELIGIYKGLRMPFLGLLILLITAYVYWPKSKARLEQPRLNMLDDELAPDLSEKFGKSSNSK